MIRTTRRMFALGALALLAGCADSNQKPPQNVVPIGEFKLGHTIVVAKHAQKVEPSKNVTQEKWDDVVTKAIEQRFQPYDGSQLYHIAVNILGYSVAVPGIPVVLAPKSVVLMDVTIWDNAKSTGSNPLDGKLNKEPKRLTIYESLSADFVVGAGLTKSSDEQVANMAANAAKQIENYMRENPDWFAARQ